MSIIAYKTSICTISFKSFTRRILATIACFCTIKAVCTIVAFCEIEDSYIINNAIYMKGQYVSLSEFFHGNSKLTLYEDDVYIYKCASRFLLVLWCLTALSKMLHLYRGSQGFCWRKPEEPEKPTDLSHVTDEHFHIILDTWPCTALDSGRQKWIYSHRKWI